MYPRQIEDRVVLELGRQDTDVYLKPFLVLDDAERALAARESELGAVQLAPYRDALEAAESDVEELFREEMTIAQAETLHRRLGGAILRAKVYRSDFTYYREGDDE